MYQQQRSILTDRHENRVNRWSIFSHTTPSQRAIKPGVGLATLWSSILALGFSLIFTSASWAAEFTNITTTNGLGSNYVNSVSVSGTTIYAATNDGLSISTDGGKTFTTKTTSDGLGSNPINGVSVSGTTIYAATWDGLSISTDGGNTFTTKTTTDGLGSNYVNSVYVSGTTIYAATFRGGLSISIDGGNTFTTKTTTDGLGSNDVWGVYVRGSTIYAETDGGRSISTDGGISFTTKTMGGNWVWGEWSVYVSGTTSYVATQDGLLIFTDDGKPFTTKTTADGLGSNHVWGVYVSGSTIYAATEGGLSFNAGYTLTVAKTGTGKGTIGAQVSGQKVSLNCTATCLTQSYDYPMSSQLNLVATPNKGFVFKGWSCTGSYKQTGTPALIKVTMDAPKTCTAMFVESVPKDKDTCIQQHYSGQLMADVDDAEEMYDGPDVGSVYLTSDNLELGYVSESRLVGFRFRDVPISKNCKVLSANLILTARRASKDPKNTTVLRITGEKSANSALFANTDSNLSQRLNKSTSAVTWDSKSTPALTAWQQNFTYTSPDLTQIIQEIIKQDGWEAYNSMAFFITGNGRRDASAFKAGPTTAAILRIQVEGFGGDVMTVR